MDLVVQHEGREEKVRVEKLSASEYEVTVGERSYRIDAKATGDVWSLLLDGRQHEVAVARDGANSFRVGTRGETDSVAVYDPLEFEVLASTGGPGAQGAQRVEAMMPGRVVKVLAAEGDSVSVGQGVLVLEAMKMENEIVAEAEGVLGQLAVEEGQAVEAGDLLFMVEDAAEE